MSKTEFLISKLETGQLNALVKNLMQQLKVNDPLEAVRLVNSNQCQIKLLEKTWWKSEDIIYLTVTSDGTTGPEWIKRLLDQGFGLCEVVKEALLAKDFGVTTEKITEVAILKAELFKKEPLSALKPKRLTPGKVCQARKLYNLKAPSLETICLVREKIDARQLAAMGISWLVFMNKPYLSKKMDKYIFDIGQYASAQWLDAMVYNPKNNFAETSGFLFEV